MSKACDHGKYNQVWGVGCASCLKQAEKRSRLEADRLRYALQAIADMPDSLESKIARLALLP